MAVLAEFVVHIKQYKFEYMHAVQELNFVIFAWYLIAVETSVNEQSLTRQDARIL